MADSSRIRYALDKSIHLGTVKSGTMVIDPNGAYTIRLLGTQASYFIEAEIIKNKLISFKSFGDASSTPTVYFAIVNKNGTSCIVYSDSSVTSSDSSVTSRLASSDLSLEAYIEYNLYPITISSDSVSLSSQDIPANIRNEFSLNKTYYLEEVILGKGSHGDLTADNISVNTLDLKTLKVNLAELKVTNNSEIKVPKLIVQTVGIQQMNVDEINATDIATRSIYLSSGNNNHGWVFNAESSGDIITLKSDIDF